MSTAREAIEAAKSRKLELELEIADVVRGACQALLDEYGLHVQRIDVSMVEVTKFSDSGIRMRVGHVDINIEPI